MLAKVLVSGLIAAFVTLLLISSTSAAVLDTSGSEITIDGTDGTFLYGVCETTALQYSVWTWIDGNTQFAGMNQNFPSPTSTLSPHATAEQFWHQYFAVCDFYGLNLIRIGAGDAWGSGIQYEAWKNHRTQFIDLLKTMAQQAEDHGVFVCLVLAGSQEYPTYQYGGSGTVFETSSLAYSNYIAYCKDVMRALDGESGIGMYDLFNEPDYDGVYTAYWQSHGSKTAFSAWAKSVASDTKGVTSHPRTMGAAGQGKMFSFSKADFDLYTGKVGFEIASRHYYASAQDNYLFADPEAWAKQDGLPLFWSELGYNGDGMYVRWPYAEQAIINAGGDAITSMVLKPMNGYPYTGGDLTGLVHDTGSSSSTDTDSGLQDDDSDTSSTNTGTPAGIEADLIAKLQALTPEQYATAGAVGVIAMLGFWAVKP
jgi:hypothetical protein